MNTLTSRNDHVSMFPKWSDPNDQPTIKFIAFILLLCLLWFATSCSDVVVQKRYESKYAKQNMSQFQKSKY